MASNHGQLNRDIIGSCLLIKGRKILDEKRNLNVRTLNVNGKTTLKDVCVKGDISVDGFLSATPIVYSAYVSQDRSGGFGNQPFGPIRFEEEVINTLGNFEQDSIGKIVFKVAGIYHITAHVTSDSSSLSRCQISKNGFDSAVLISSSTTSGNGNELLTQSLSIVLEMEAGDFIYVEESDFSEFGPGNTIKADSYTYICIHKL